MNDKKLWKCICRKSEMTEKDEVLIGFFGEEGEPYFKGVNFLWYKKHWTGGDTVCFSRDDFEKTVVRFYEI